ncbi:MAG: hypothetical protein JOY96_00015 [Verrucomicrobia bacterium]|nr:hypothetical protein [Verrucomicrobiota bacterium]
MFELFVIWLVFKLFVQLQARQFVPTEVLLWHLCWGFVTLWFFAITYFGSSPEWAQWAVLLAYILYLTVIHTLLRRLRAAREGRSGKRLLLLRVFGQADKRERLVDALDTTWRYVGRIDLIAGTDLATRTMGSRMIEAFLLRRTDDRFLKPPEEVEERLKRLHHRVEGDARYPVNAVYCYADAWQSAVSRMAPTSDAVLMDLRGFTMKNEGCVTELKWIVQHLRLSQILLLTDATTDHPALLKVAEMAWGHLPASSSNHHLQEPVLTILNATRNFRKSREALFTLVLSVSVIALATLGRALMGPAQ